MAEAIKTSKHLSHVDLSYNSFTAREAGVLSTAISESTSLKEVIFDGVVLKPESFLCEPRPWELLPPPSMQAAGST